MDVEFDKSFLKSLDKIKDQKILQKIEQIIFECESAKKLSDINNLKKLSGFPNYYRIKFGSYRLGFEFIEKEKIRFIVFSHRKDIYKNFP
jgi:mRNA interferase RelE/StbE